MSKTKTKTETKKVVSTNNSKTEMFECPICYEDIPVYKRNKKQKIECFNKSCKFECCIECQKKYAEMNCMKCKAIFKLLYMKNILGVKFVSEVIKPKIIETLMIEQKEKLKIVQPLVEWEKKLREIKKKKRFGIFEKFPERPNLHNIRKNNILACPNNKCRGFVVNCVCEICKVVVCIKCNVIVKEDKNQTHVCNEADLYSVALIEQECKPCPSCYTNIMRSYGCNHMFCTNCRTHFNWENLKILQNSTNHHYDDLKVFNKNIITFRNDDGTIRGDLEEPDKENNFSIYRHNVPIENIDTTKYSEQLIMALYGDSNIIRLFKKEKFNESTIIRKVEEEFQELQIKYLLQDIDIKKWSASVYRINHKKNMDFLYCQVINLYLETVGHFQSKIKNYNPSLEKYIIAEYKKLIVLCNTSFKSIYDDYGGTLYQLRDIDDKKDVTIMINTSMVETNDGDIIEDTIDI